MSIGSVPAAGLIWLCLTALLCAVCPAAEPEILHLKSGDRFTGTSRGIVDGSLVWSMPYGDDLLIPLDEVDHLELQQPLFAPVAAAEPREPSEAAPSPLTPDEAVSGGEGVEPWTNSVPFQSTVARVYSYSVESVRTWTKRVQFGGQFNQGNSNNDLLDFGADFENSTETTTRQFDLGGQFGRANGVTNVSRYWLNGNIDHKLHESWIFFGTSKNEHNQFTNLDYRGTLSGGVGYRFYNEPERRLIVRLGPGVTIENFRAEPYSRTTPDLFGELEARWPILDRSQFEQKSRVNPSVTDFEIVRIVSTSSLLVDLDQSDRWKLRLSFRFEYNSQPAAGRLPADYLTSVTLMYVRR